MRGMAVLIALIVGATGLSAPTARLSARRPARGAPAAMVVDAPERPARSASVSDMSKELADVRARMMEDEDTRLMMQALRGQNLNDNLQADAGVQMDVVRMRASTGADDQLPLLFEPHTLKRYFAKRPGAVLTRVLQIASKSAGLALGVLLDLAVGNTEDIEVRRAADLRRTIISLGPFFIKLGQALSIRPDVLSPRAMVELQQLCDKVPSFDNELAMRTICDELKVAQVSDVFSEITPAPVAAASLGQVYRATLRESGDIVAVKVQRPYVLETVSLDLHLARELGLLLRRFPALSKRLDLVELLDEFGSRFYAELDYVVECQNGERIRREMAKMPMVVIPTNYPRHTTRRVHVAEWVEGEKLSQSKADDVGALVNLGVIVYLSQLLDSGFFHADPHPGNMLRTPDGRLVILDFGLMTEITDDQKYGMIEAIAHLIHRDYALIGQDFVNLDFIPKGTDLAPIIPALSRVFDAALAGGGAKSINFQELAADLAQITFDYPFRIPPYFALVIRAIGVLEGIALVGNPNFAIVDEAYPYISKRLLTDESPRLRAALKYMVYGRSDTFDVDRMIDLLQALEKYAAVRDNGDGSAFKVDGKRGDVVLGSAGSFAGTRTLQPHAALSNGGNNGNGGNGGAHTVARGGLVPTGASGERADLAAAPTGGAAGGSAGGSLVSAASTREALDFFFSREGRPFREFLLDEVTRSVDTLSRDAIAQIGFRVGLRGQQMPALLRALAPPVTDKDRKVVENISRLIEFLLGDFNSAAPTSGSVANRSRQLAQLQALLPVLREYAPSMREFGLLLVTRLTEKQASRAFAWAKQSIEAGAAA